MRLQLRASTFDNRGHRPSFSHAGLSPHGVMGPRVPASRSGLVEIHNLLNFQTVFKISRRFIFGISIAQAILHRRKEPTARKEVNQTDRNHVLSAEY
jgi:hypothetical protein